MRCFDALGLDDGGLLPDQTCRCRQDTSRSAESTVQPSLQDEPPDGAFLLRRKNAGVSSEAAVRDRLAGNRVGFAGVQVHLLVRSSPSLASTPG